LKNKIELKTRRVSPIGEKPECQIITHLILATDELFSQLMNDETMIIHSPFWLSHVFFFCVMLDMVYD